MSRTVLHLFRHGQTDWNVTTQHTGHTDIPLNAQGRAEALLLQRRIAHLQFDRVWSSSLSRAKETCTLAGLADRATFTADLWEWHYGSWEGRTRAQIMAAFPGWDMWTQGAPEGESVAAVIARVDRVLGQIEEGHTTAVFAHGHVLRVVACRWLGWPLAQGRALMLGNCAHSVLGREEGLSYLESWNRLS
jgi:broad specificity phosphatase PhoE